MTATITGAACAKALMPAEIRDALLIFNPRAGRAEIAHLERARKILSGHGITSELAPTEGPGAATALAQGAVQNRRQLVIVCGGDGTLNEVINGLAHSPVPVALLPAGTANIMAKELGLPWNVERAAALVATSNFRRIALGLVIPEESSKSRYFLSVAGAGPDGVLVRAVNTGLKKRTGTLAYWAEGFRQLTLYNFPRFRLSTAEFTVDASLVVVGRTKNYGGPLRITTQADLYGDDFELMVCSTSSRWKYMCYLPLLCAGQLRRARQAHFLRAKTVRCEPLDEESIWIQVDGEPAGRLPAEFRIVPDALTLAVPKTASR